MKHAMRSTQLVFAVSPACFLTARWLEEIKNDICYSDHAVVVVGISAGMSYGALGTTRHLLHDFAVLRAINNLTVVAPADNIETREAVRAAARPDKPVYLRCGKAAARDERRIGCRRGIQFRFQFHQPVQRRVSSRVRVFTS